MNNLTFRNLSIFAFAVFLSLTLNSCKKQETDTSTSFMRVVNTSPSSPTYNVYLNGTKLNSAALPYAGGTAYASYPAGSYTVKFTAASSAESLFSTTVALSASSYYSHYLIGKPGSLDGLTVADDLSMTSADKAYIRFIHLSPDAPALDLAKTEATSSLFSNKAYKSASAFIAVDAGTYALDAKETSTGAIKASLTSTNFVAGYHYDIICGGLATPANDTEKPLNLQAILIK